MSPQKTTTVDSEMQALLIEHVPDVLSRHDPQGVFLYASPAAQSILGHDPDKLVGRSMTDLAHSDDKSAVQACYRNAATSPHSSITVSFRLAESANAVKWIEMSIRGRRDPDTGMIIDVVCVSRDITARASHSQSQLSEQAQRLETRFDTLIATVPGMVWESWYRPDPEKLRTNYVSNYVEQMTGYTQAEWMPDSWLRIMHPEDREHIVTADRQGVAQGTSQYRWITKDGRTIWVENHFSVVFDEAGAPVGVRGVTLDVTPRKLVEEERERLQAEIIRAQAENLAEVSTPLIPISKKIMVMPLVGGIDSARAGSIIETLLYGIGRSQALFAIVDITGVRTVDSHVADTLIRAAKAVELLGAKVVLTGIRPEVARTLVALGADLGGIVTHSTLENGIAHAMKLGQ